MALARNRGTTPEGPIATVGAGTRASARHTTRLPQIDEKQEILNSSEAHTYLEKKSLIMPPGGPISPGILSTALHFVTEYPGLSRPASNAIRSVAILLEEMEENSLHETVRDSVTVQLNELSNDLKDLFTDTTQQIDKHVEDKLSMLSDPTKDLMDSVRTALNKPSPSGGLATSDGPPAGYRQALLRPPPHVDPRLAAKEGIRIRQFLIEGVPRDSKLGKMNGTEAKKTVNQALEKAGSNGLKARSALRQNKTGLLIEMDSDAGAVWLMDPENAKTLCSKLGPGLTFKQRPFNVLAYNASTALDPNSPSHIQEITEVNDIQDGGLLAMRWVKPVNRRERADQRTAHLILTFSNAEDANRAILAGLVVCNRRLRIAKSKKEPIRCMKCHHWNHVAGECIAKEDTCGTCGEKGHWTKDCINNHKKHCTSCNSDEHASWSRYCPTFLRKCEELDKRTPENGLPFFPSVESWTWSSTPPLAYPTPPAAPPPISIRGRNQQDRIQSQKNMAPSGRPYERQSWTRPTSTNRFSPTDKLDFSNFQYPPASLEQTLTDQFNQPADSQDIYA